MPVLTMSKQYVRGVERAELRLLQTVTFSSSGTFTPANYPGLRAVTVHVFGAGGGAGGGAGTPVQPAPGGGGAYGRKWFLGSQLSPSCAVVVGAGGAGGFNTANGAGGGHSEFISSTYRSNGGGGGEGATATSQKVWFGGYGGGPSGGHQFDYVLPAQQSGFSLHLNIGNCTTNNSIAGGNAPSLWSSLGMSNIVYIPNTSYAVRDNNGLGSHLSPVSNSTPAAGGGPGGSQCTGGGSSYGQNGGSGIVIVEVYG